MLLLRSEDESHGELQSLAKQVSCRFEDMNPVPDTPGAFRLPRPFLPAAAIELYKCFYDRERDKIFKWARRKGLRIDKKPYLGPQIVWLRCCKLSAVENRVSFSIVVPNPYEAETVGAESDPRGLAAAQGGQAVVSITSSLASDFSAYSRPDLEVGDVIILEGKEELSVSYAKKTAGEAQGICLVSAMHVASFVGEGEGGWNENIIIIEEEGQPVA